MEESSGSSEVFNLQDIQSFIHKHLDSHFNFFHRIRIVNPNTK